MIGRLLAFGAGAALCFVSTSANAQANGSCADILKGGAFQTAQYRDDSYFQQIIWSRFLRYSDQQSSTDRSGGFGIPVGEIVVGGNASDSQYKSKRESIKSEYFNQITASRELDVALASGDPAIIDAWSTCMARSSGGLTMRFEPATPTTVSLHLQYFPQGTRNKVKLKEKVALPAGAQVMSGDACLKKNKQIVAGNICRATIKLRSPLDYALVAVNADHSSAEAFLPARVILARQVKDLTGPTFETWAFRETKTPSESVRLSDADKALGWRLDTSSVSIRLDTIYKLYWNNHCVNEWSRPSEFGYEYGHTAIAQGSGKGRNSSIGCRMSASAVARRDVWLPQADVPSETAAGGGALGTTSNAGLLGFVSSATQPRSGGTTSALSILLDETPPQVTSQTISLW